MLLLLLTFTLAFLISLYGVPLARQAALKHQLVDRPDGRLKQQRGPVPYLGGLALYLAFLASLAFTFEFRQDVLGVLLAGTLVMMLGLIDDLGVLSPGKKLAGQLIAVFVLIKSGIRIEIAALPDWLDLTLTVHLKGHFACSHHAARRMVQQRSGSIVTVTSRALHGHPGSSPYAAVKAGILGATWSWALELADYGVRVNCVSPAAVRPGEFETTQHVTWYTDFRLDKGGHYNPQPTADTVAPLVVYLASDLSRRVSGQVIFLSGDTLALMDQPQYRFAFRPQGWSARDVAEALGTTLRPFLAPPGQGEPAYRWRDGVGPVK